MSAPMIALAALLACTPGDSTTSVRGLAAQVDVEYAARLRARSDQSRDSPILVRVSAGLQPGHQRIEFIGAVAGPFDLRNYLEREDGQPPTDLPPIPVTVVSKLPADAGVDLYGTGDSWLNWRVHYRQLMWTAIGLWLAVPAAALGIRAVRRPRHPAPAAQAPPPPTVADQLRSMLEVARERPLSLHESGGLELLLLRYLGGAAGDDTDLAAVLAQVRADEGTRDLVLAVEHWLHAKNTTESAREYAADALEALRRTRLAAPDARPQPHHVEVDV